MSPLPGSCRAVLAFISAFAVSVPASALDLDLGNARVVAEFELGSHSFNMLVKDGWLIYPDSASDTIFVRDLTESRPDRDFRSPVTRATYIAPAGGDQYVVSDAYNNQVAKIDVASSRQLGTYEWRDHFGPLHLLVSDGVVYGANMGDRLITKLDVRSMTQQTSFASGSGPMFMVAARGLIFVAEVGAYGVPGDDHIAWYEAATGRLVKRLAVKGAIAEMIPWRDGVCMTLRFEKKIRCGDPERNVWYDGVTGTDPWGVVEVGDYLWVLSRGEGDEEAPSITVYVLVNEHFKPLKTFDIGQLRGMELPRGIAYDETSKSILVRGLQSIVTVPVDLTATH